MITANRSWFRLEPGGRETPARIVRVLFAWGVLVAYGSWAAADEIRINLDRPGCDRDGTVMTDADPAAGFRGKGQGIDIQVKPRIDAAGFSIVASAEGYIQKLEPTVLQLETQQRGRWVEPKLETGRYLKKEFDPDRPQRVKLESTLKFDLSAGDRRFQQERDAIQKEVQTRVGGKDAAVVAKAKQQLLLERLSTIREENVKSGADRRGKVTAHTPPLPRQGLNFEKPDVLEKLLKEQCCWQSVADVFKATGFPPPDEKDFPDFSASQTMANEIHQALMGIKINARHLTEGQYNALANGNRYEFTAQFVPGFSEGQSDALWKTAPGLRLADGLVKRAQLEGGLNRERGQTVQWWRVECDTPQRIQPQMLKGDGDCFWTWVETPHDNVRYLRLLLHSPETRYRMSLSLSGAAKGEELVIYDGPFNPPVKTPF